MRRINTKFLNDNMTLATNIYSAEGTILMKQGVELTSKLKQKFDDLGVHEVYVEDSISHGIIVKDYIDPSTRLETKIAIKEMFQQAEANKLLDFSNLSKAVNKLIDELLHIKDVFIDYVDPRTISDYIYGHSLNVCIYSIIIAIGLGYNMLKLKEIAMGAVLHDIGMAKIGKDITNKKGRLTPEEQKLVEKHTTFGYEMIKRTTKLPLTATFCALAHHESIDGKGYPNRLAGESIHEYARIVSVSDVLDALVSDRTYKERIHLHHAYEFITGHYGIKYDKSIGDVLLSNIAIFPTGTGVILNTGEKALVIKASKQSRRSPVVRIILDSKGSAPLIPKEFDLSKHKKHFIVDVFDI